MNWWKKYWKQAITIPLMLFIVVSAVLADGWSDNADSKAWWVLWEVWWVVALVIVVGVWGYHWFFNPKQKRNK